MPEINIPPCPTHGARPRALHEESFFGIVTVIEELIGTISGVGTSSYSRCSYGYPSNFEGVVRALEDLNTSISGISGGGGGSIGAGSGIYLTQGGTVVNVDYDAVYDNVVSGHFLDEGSVTITYSGNNVIISGTDTSGGGGGGGASVTVSGEPGTGYSTGDLWFDVNQGRMLVYASGGSVSDPDWYQTNAEAIVLKSDTPPSGTGTNAPPRDGSLWFSELVGSLFVYDAVTSGWYETGPRRSFAYSATAPSAQVAGEGWYDDTANALKVWNGTAWVDANT
jgi:hypothetical protein